MTNYEKLSALYNQAGSLNEDNPKELIDKINLYADILIYLGGFCSEAFKEYQKHEYQRKAIVHNAIYYRHKMEDGEEPTSDKRAEAVGEILASESRINEHKYKSEHAKWETAMKTTTEKINAMKKKYDHLKEVAKGGV